MKLNSQLIKCWRLKLKTNQLKKSQNNLNWIGLIHQTYDPGYETGISHRKQIKK